ncbi:MAG: hypothetical protein JWR63_3300, partial [Conexibacter sp.]|nr:hypothetical protein [Conexibacter sp.]
MSPALLRPAWRRPLLIAAPVLAAFLLDRLLSRDFASAALAVALFLAADAALEARGR